MFRFLISILIGQLLVVSGFGQTGKPYVVMISLDGFRWDFPEVHQTPNLKALAAEGVKAASLIPSFPTKTFPNHYSIITGLYPDHHGIVANKFIDPQTGKTFALNTKEKLDPYYYSGIPFWISAEESGIKTASYNWPGSELEIHGRRPSIWKPYAEVVPLDQRIDTLVSWLQLPDAQRPHFITAYFEQPDKVLHKYGPDAQASADIVQYVDSLVGVLRYKLSLLPIADSINLLILSDHGMSALSEKRVDTLSNYIPDHWLAYPAMGTPIIFLKAAEGYYDSIASVIKTIPHARGYVSKKIPRRFHFGKNARALDFTLMVDNGYTLLTPSDKFEKGTHGFDYVFKDMHGIFYATGPLFKKGATVRSFKNIHISKLLAHMFSIHTPPNDGSFKKVKNVLR